MEHLGDSNELTKFVKSRGIARTQEIADAGFSRILLTRLVRRGELQRLGRGIYTTSTHPLSEWHDLAEVSKAIPSAVITLISALAYHEIGTHVPYELWIALPIGAREPTYHQKMRITRLSEPYYSEGITEHQIEGVMVRIYSPAKTIADCFRMRSKVGYEVAVEALKEGWRLRKFTLDELHHFAKINRVDRIMRPYIEAIAT